MAFYTTFDDLTHIVGPLTEESIIRCLKARFQSQIYQTNVGPNVICINSFSGESHDQHIFGDSLKSLVQHVLSQHQDTGYSQVIILCGEIGSGKTVYCQQTLDSIFQDKCSKEVRNHILSAMKVMQAFSTASTPLNPHSSRMGFYIEAMTSDCVIYRSKIHCLFVDHRRVTDVPRDERNYHIFYYMLSGLTSEERVKLHLEGYNIHNLLYLSNGLKIDVDKTRHKLLFEEWKKCLNMLNIPVMDVLRILTAVLLLGNIQFLNGDEVELEVTGTNELKSTSALLGISGVAIYRGLTTISRNSNGQICHTVMDFKQANHNCDVLARALYFRTVSAILKRVNSLKKANSDSHPSLESLESQNSSAYNSRPDILSLSHGSASQQHGRTFADGFIGILDMYGFENLELNGLERLCRNVCAEKIQNHFIKHVFIAPLEALCEECITPDVEVTFTNNSDVIDLLYSQPNGILPLLSRHNDIHQIKNEHRTNNYFFEPLPKCETMFGVRHFSRRVNYDAEDFQTTNQDQIPDDVVTMFSKRNCNFGFASHLFSSELKQISNKGICGCRYRTMPSCNQDYISEMDNQGVLSYDFSLRLDAILKSIGHAKPYYIHCLKSNDELLEDNFDSDVVLRQIRTIQLQETVRLMAEVRGLDTDLRENIVFVKFFCEDGYPGLPHRIKYRVFNNRYKIFMLYRLSHKPDCTLDESKEILECFLRRMDKSNQPYITTQWIYGRKHIFYSESSRQCFEKMRLEILNTSATVIQFYWKNYWARRCSSIRSKSRNVFRKSRNVAVFSQCITVPHRPTEQLVKNSKPYKEKIDKPLSHYISKVLSKSLNKTPSLPSNRSYVINGNQKIFFPQVRIFNEKFKVHNMENTVFQKEDRVIVSGVSHRPGFIIVQSSNKQYHVPYHLLDIQKKNP